MSVGTRIRRLEAASPFYAQQLRQHPDWIDWLDKPKNRDFEYRYNDLNDLWRRKFRGDEFSLAKLRQFRRRMSLRIAYRELNDLADVDVSWRELSLLAEFVVERLCEWRMAQWRENLGEPICEDTGQPASYCIFAQGKLGAGELNFCSDLDLLFCIEGNGPCRKRGKDTALTTREFYDRFFRQIAEDLTERTADGALYYLDLRLRPEGEAGPIVRTAESLTAYYWDCGQTWERLAWLRARRIAGSRELAHQILDEVNPFRYPRFPPASLRNEVAGVKLRTEKEVSADELARDIKTGPGGIREIEFIVQAQQLVHGGANPFLQTHSTVQALEKLARYDNLSADDACFLHQAYRWLRRLENRLQMRGETPRHVLPATEEEQAWLAHAMGAPDWATFASELKQWRDGVRERYLERFPADPQEEHLQTWTAFLAGQPPSAAVDEQITRWFPHSEDAEARLRRFVLGDAPGIITRDAVQRFLDLATHFERILSRLAHPMLTLERIGRFAESYGARRHFFRDSANPALFETLSLLFDRSGFIFELLCRHPGIMEELLHEAPKRLKSRDECREEIQLLAPGGEGFADRLWLYVKAEQVRMAIAELLHDVSLEAVGWALSQLAEAVVAETLKLANLRNLTVVALGKFGAEELSLGSDLDILLLWDHPPPDAPEKIRRWLAMLNYATALGPMFQTDLRLRPHGDAGPIVISQAALEKYHASAARRWERQVLVRARPIAGPKEQQTAFEQWRRQLLYSAPLPCDDLEAAWRMRRRIEQEKPSKRPPAERAFKTGPGGMLDLEFLAELLALTHGAQEPELRQPHARTCLLAAAAKGLMPGEIVDQLINNWQALRGIEFNLRRLAFQPVAELPDDEAIIGALGRWLGWPELSDFWRRYTDIFAQNRRALLDWLEQARGGGCPDQTPPP